MAVSLALLGVAALVGLFYYFVHYREGAAAIRRAQQAGADDQAQALKKSQRTETIATLVVISILVVSALVGLAVLLAR